ncbi:hypothetical protein [Streptomyces sp. NPDC090445]|uniref:hypothetical protein n=1 Tax=Streptomyces sp. NPDC090445 TaxID=3365963 RepID=UPI00380D5088
MPEPKEQSPGPESGRVPSAPPSETGSGPEPGSGPGSGLGSGSFLEKAAYITAPATVALGLLYYFGSTYTDAYYAYFGIPTSDLQFSVQKYVVESPAAVFFPLWLLMICGLVVLLVLGSVGRALAVPGREAVRRRVTACLLAIGSLLLVLGGFPAYFMEGRLPPLPSGWLREFLPCLVVALGATLAFFAVQLHLSRGSDEPGRRERTGDRLWLAGGALLIGLFAMSLFFAMSRYAAQAGTTAAAELKAGGYVAHSPRVVVHSKVSLPHHLGGIKFKDRGPGSAPFRYEYRGFRLLVKSPSRYYFVSYAESEVPQLVVLPDDETVRVEISP